MPFVCPAPGGATLTFTFRLWPSAEHPGVIDSGHKGPCAVYMKKMDDMLSDSAAGPGWFKIWEDGYDVDADRWCVDTLIEKDGLLSVNIPSGLPAGYYLVRPEVLALHAAYRGDPQYFLGCAQIFVEDGPDIELDVPEEYSVSIPGYVDADTPSLNYDIYQTPMPSYSLPGPKVHTSTNDMSTSSTSSTPQKAGTIPSDCILKNANWCAEPVMAYAGEDECWEGVDACYAQSKDCWESAPPTGSANCYTWSDYCALLDESCAAGDFEGPLEFEGKEEYADVPGSIPEPWGSSATDDVTEGEVVNAAVVVEEDEEDQLSTSPCDARRSRHARSKRAARTKSVSA